MNIYKMRQQMHSWTITDSNTVGLTFWRLSLARLYRVIQEEMSIFRKMMVSFIVRKKVQMYTCLILNNYRDRADWIYTYKKHWEW